MHPFRTVARPRGVGTLTALSLATLLLASGPSAQAADPPYGTASADQPAPCPATTTDCPSADPFYAAPANLAALADGTIIRTRPTALGTPDLTVASATTLIYRSEDSFGKAEVGSAIVLLPAVPWAGNGPQPLVSEQFAEDSLGAQCRPSYTLTHSGGTGADSVAADQYLAQGIDVVIPDFQGLSELYEVGPQAGHSILDGIRAAEALPAAGLTAATPVVLNGYSGGAFATGWAAELARSYAPALTIVGASMGGTPADQKAVGKYLDGTLFEGFALLVTVALDRAFPATGIYADLNAKGQALFASIQSDCLDSVATTGNFTHLDDYTTTPDTLDSPAVSATLAHDDLGQAPPVFPVLDYHVYNDEIVQYAQDEALVKTYCNADTPVEGATITGDHISGEVVGYPLALAFAQQRFQGTPAVDTCALTDQLPTLPQLPAVALPDASATASPAATPSPSSPTTTTTTMTTTAAGSGALHATVRRTTVRVTRHASPQAPQGTLAYTGPPAGVGAAALTAVGAGLLLRRRRRSRP